MLTYIPVGEEAQVLPKSETIYLTTNGAHMDIVIPRDVLRPELLEGLKHSPNEQFFAFGWGEENFYLNTPSWGDATFGKVFKAAFLKNTTLVHLTKYTHKQEKWIPVPLSKLQLERLNAYLLDSFLMDNQGQKILLKGKGYSSRDDFYKAKGRYSYRNTCNTWANTGFKKSGMKAALWTPFDFGVMGRYE